MFLWAVTFHVKLVQSNRRSREISLKTVVNFDLPSLVKEQMLLRCFFFLLLHRIIPKFSFQHAVYWQAHLIHLPSVWEKVRTKLKISPKFWKYALKLKSFCCSLQCIIVKQVDLNLFAEVFVSINKLVFPIGSCFCDNRCTRKRITAAQKN